MTLVAHIWTKNINIVSSDRRLINPSSRKSVSENTKKTYPNGNSFVSFHGHYEINPDLNTNEFIEKYYLGTKFENGNSIATNLRDNFTKLKNRQLSTGFIIGGHFNRTESLYCNSNGITQDNLNNPIGCRMNYENEAHHSKLIELLDASINLITGNKYNSWNKYDNYTNDQFLKIFTAFHERIHLDCLANPVNGIGTEFDLGIIRQGEFEWIQNNDN